MPSCAVGTPEYRCERTVRSSKPNLFFLGTRFSLRPKDALDVIFAGGASGGGGGTTREEGPAASASSEIILAATCFAFAFPSLSLLFVVVVVVCGPGETVVLVFVPPGIGMGAEADGSWDGTRCGEDNEESWLRLRSGSSSDDFFLFLSGRFWVPIVEPGAETLADVPDAVFVPVDGLVAGDGRRGDRDCDGWRWGPCGWAPAPA